MMASDVWFSCPNRAYARLISSHQQETVRRFLFAHAFDTGPARPNGAGHGSDLFYVLHLFPFPWWTPSPRETALSDIMTGYWTRFAATGDPNGAGAPMWTPYDASADSYFVFDTPIGTAAGLRQAQCDFIDQVH
jgi:para-nitrobenzyl esterase